MAAFTESFELENSPDGKTITVRDTSNYADSDEVYTAASFTRAVEIRNSLDVLVATVEMGADLEKTFTITSDLWAKAKFTWSGIGAISGVDYEKELIYPLDRISKNMFLKELSENGCSCSNKNNYEAMINADLFFTGMEFAAPAGEGIRWQSYANTAYKFLDSIR